VIFRSPWNGFPDVAVQTTVPKLKSHPDYDAAKAVATGRYDFDMSVKRALAYERSVFDATTGNWPVFHSQSKPMLFVVSWCNGAPGIALSRLALYGTHLWDAGAEAELMTALATTSAGSASAIKGADHLCCGRLGLSAILRYASATLAEPDLLAAAQRFESASLRQAAKSGGNYCLVSTQEGQLHLPGLFTGIACSRPGPGCWVRSTRTH
jgi:lantibiotic modifying enzyme